MPTYEVVLEMATDWYKIEADNEEEAKEKVLDSARRSANFVVYVTEVK